MGCGTGFVLTIRLSHLPRLAGSETSPIHQRWQISPVILASVSEYKYWPIYPLSLPRARSWWDYHNRPIDSTIRSNVFFVEPCTTNVPGLFTVRLSVTSRSIYTWAFIIPSHRYLPLAQALAPPSCPPFRFGGTCFAVCDVYISLPRSTPFISFDIPLLKHQPPASHHRLT